MIQTRKTSAALAAGLIGAIGLGAAAEAACNHELRVINTRGEPVKVTQIQVFKSIEAVKGLYNDPRFSLQHLRRMSPRVRQELGLRDPGDPVQVQTPNRRLNPGESFGLNFRSKTAKTDSVYVLVVYDALTRRGLRRSVEAMTKRAKRCGAGVRRIQLRTSDRAALRVAR